ncbi:hypothetical protein BOX15_Mlig004227g1, partial [Macrostomum lignano]
DNSSELTISPATVGPTSDSPEAVDVGDDYQYIWLTIFLWTMGLSLVLHLGALVVSAVYLRLHRIGKVFPLLFIVGFVYSLPSHAISGLCLAFVYYSASLLGHSFFSFYHAIAWSVVLNLLSTVLPFSGLTSLL